MKKHVSQKVLASTLACVMAVGMGAACVSADSSVAEAPTSDVTLEFQQWWGVELPDGYLQKVVDDYKAKTGVTVKLLNAPWADTKTAITAGASTGTVADIMSVDGAWLYDFVDQGILTDMSALMEADGYDTSALADQWQIDGKTYAIPQINYAYPMFVNMDILKDSGITDLPKTWTEFEEACKKITAKGYDAFGLNLDTANPNGIQNVFMGFAWASGIKMKDDSGNYKISGNKDLQDFADFMKKLNDDGSIYAGKETLSEADMTGNFASGKVAFCINSTAQLSAYRDAGINVAAMPVPVKDGYTGKSGMCVASWACGISDSSKHKDEAMKFVEYLMSGLDGKDGSVDAERSVTQSGFPGSTVAKPDYSKADEVFQDVYKNYSDNCYPINEFVGMKEANTVMTDMTNDLIKFFDGEEDSAKLLDNMQAAVDDVYNS